MNREFTSATEHIIPAGRGLSFSQRSVKRGFDLVVASLGLVLTGWLIGVAYLLASIDTGESGFFRQVRVGRYGCLFRIVKIRTMLTDPQQSTTVTTAADSRITSLGAFFRKTKVDELPQLFNILMGHMSFVGPRPDVPGFTDQLTAEDRVILAVRPGITGPATLAFRDEEVLLARQQDPEVYNRDVIYPEKVRLNREYIENYSFLRDIMLIFRTCVPWSSGDHTTAP